MIGDDVRESATSRLDMALREGRLDLAEHERRRVVVQAATVLADLTPAIADLPERSGQTGPELRISTVEREQALVRLSEALTDGRLQATEYPGAEELLHRAVRYADVDAVVGNLDARASLVERDRAIASIETAAADGLLDATDRHGRVLAARNAVTVAQLAALTADLPADTRSPDAPLRASNTCPNQASRPRHNRRFRPNRRVPASGGSGRFGWRAPGRTLVSHPNRGSTSSRCGNCTGTRVISCP